MPKGVHETMSKQSGQEQQRTSLDDDQQIFHRKKKRWSQASRAKGCKVQREGYCPSLQGREWHGSKKKEKKTKQNERTRVRGRILSDPPRRLKGESRLIRQRTQAMVIRIPASMPGAITLPHGEPRWVTQGHL